MTDTQTTEELLASRREVYGDRIENMIRTSQIWSGLTGYDIKPFQVPLMMAAYKSFRASVTPDYSDNIDDVDGWNQMFREVVGDDLIQARTVEEYLELKAERAKPAEEEFMPDPKPSETIADWEERSMNVWEKLAPRPVQPLLARDEREAQRAELKRQLHQERYADSGVAGDPDAGAV